MGLKDSLVSMMGDFVQMNKSPDYRSKTNLCNAMPQGGAENGPRRHSLNIIGGGGVRQRTFSITPEMQKHLEKINQRAMKKSATTGDAITQQHKDQDEDEEARYRQHRQRRASEPVFGPVSREHKSNSRKSGHLSKSKSKHEDETMEARKRHDSDEKKSRRKSSRTRETRSRSRSGVTQSRKSSGALNLKIDEEECDEYGNCRIIGSSPATAPAASLAQRRRATSSGGGSNRGSTSSANTPATPIPENWEAERHYAHHDGITTNPLGAELDRIERANVRDQSKKRNEKENQLSVDGNTEGSQQVACKVSTASRKSSMGIYPPPAGLLTNITRF